MINPLLLPVLIKNLKPTENVAKISYDRSLNLVL